MIHHLKIQGLTFLWQRYKKVFYLAAITKQFLRLLLFCLFLFRFRNKRISGIKFFKKTKQNKDVHQYSWRKRPENSARNSLGRALEPDFRCTSRACRATQDFPAKTCLNKEGSNQQIECGLALYVLLSTTICVITVFKMLWTGGEGGAVLPEKLGGGVRHASWNPFCDSPYPISDLPYNHFPRSDQFLRGYDTLDHLFLQNQI